MMTNRNTHKTFAGSYLQGLNDLVQYGRWVPPVEDPNSVGSRFGKEPRRTLELLGYSFEVADPRACLVMAKPRPLRLPFCYGLFVWTLAGSDDTEGISYYNPLARDFSDDGTSMAAAFGKRLFANHFAVDQFEAIAKRLSLDPQSRRTVATIASPDDNRGDSRDYPCAVAIQFFLRERRLHAITYMRSQSALMVLPYDGFLFMALQCWLASRVGVEPGLYTHVVGSFHLYEDELALAERVMVSGAESLSIGAMTTPEINWRGLIEFEREQRTVALTRDLLRLDRVIEEELVNGWDGTFVSEARRILLVYAAQRLGMHGRIGSLLKDLPLPIRNVMADSSSDERGQH